MGLSVEDEQLRRLVRQVRSLVCMHACAVMALPAEICNLVMHSQKRRNHQPCHAPR